MTFNADPPPAVAADMVGYDGMRKAGVPKCGAVADDIAQWLVSRTGSEWPLLA